jgi:hypothetical protein
MNDTLELEEITAPSGTLLDVEVASEAELQAYAAALVDADDEAFLAAAQDARRVFEAVKRARLYAAMAGLLAAPDTAVDAEDDLLAGCPLWPIASCADLSALAATTRETRAER